MVNNNSIFGLIKVILVTLVLSVSFNINSQDIGQNIDKLINDGNFDLAIEIGKTQLSVQGDDPDLNFKIGYSYMNTVLYKHLAIPYFVKSSQSFNQSNPKSEMAILASFYLGQAYHKNYEFEKALKIFNSLREIVSRKKMIERIDEEIKQCEVGIKLKKEPVEMEVVNLGKNINSGYSEHSPVISADESVMIFTSRRKPADNSEIKRDGQYHEDIYLSRFDGAEWEVPVSISKNINTDAHEASISISADGQELFIYNEADGGTILSSKLEGEVWSKPQNLGSEINTRWRETHASISADGKYLYFTSDRPGGYGGLDIYVSKREKNGEWGKAENLGPQINTSDDEESPFIHFDGTTLYFSSKGHPTMGGYDIFYSKKQYYNGWTKPENLGYPVNTTENDAFFVTNPDGKRAYYASYQNNGFGSTDIYMISLPNSEDKNVVVVNGDISVCDNYREKVTIDVIIEETDSLIGSHRPNSMSGEFLFVLKKGEKYNIIFKVDGYEAYAEDFDIGIDDDYKVISLSVDLTNSAPCTGRTIV
jgi:Tol biopolymer transport system component